MALLLVWPCPFPFSQLLGGGWGCGYLRTVPPRFTLATVIGVSTPHDTCSVLFDNMLRLCLGTKFAVAPILSCLIVFIFHFSVVKFQFFHLYSAPLSCPVAACVCRFLTSFHIVFSAITINTSWFPASLTAGVKVKVQTTCLILFHLSGFGTRNLCRMGI